MVVLRAKGVQVRGVQRLQFLSGGAALFACTCERDGLMTDPTPEQQNTIQIVMAADGVVGQGTAPDPQPQDDEEEK